MEQLIKFVLSTAGLTWLLTKGTIFNGLRNWITNRNIKTGGRISWFFREMLKCTACTGFWSGILNYFLIFVWKLDVIVYPFVGMICSYILVGYARYLERKN